MAKPAVADGRDPYCPSHHRPDGHGHSPINHMISQCCPVTHPPPLIVGTYKAPHIELFKLQQSADCSNHRLTGEIKKEWERKGGVAMSNFHKPLVGFFNIYHSDPFSIIIF